VTAAGFRCAPAAARRLRTWVTPAVLLLTAACAGTPARWQVLDAEVPTARHEASLIAHQGKLYLLGGRRINPVEVFDPQTGRWEQKSATPLELHHFQAVSYGDAIYLIGAMTGGYPDETPVDRVIKYYPEDDRFEFGHPIPESRQRGGVGAVVYEDKIYIVGGITRGHRGGYQPWLDEYDPATGDWRALPDAPNARDHFQAVVVGNRLYAFAGRRSSQETGETLNLTVRYGNVFDLTSEQWLPVTENLAIPTPRAGNMAIAHGRKIIIAGGESGTQVAAHSEVEVFDTTTQSWASWPPLASGRHGSGLAVLDGYLYTATGSGNRGGEPELVSIERIRPATAAAQEPVKPNDDTEVVMRWHTATFPFAGPMTSEDAAINPFRDYRLTVTFEHEEVSYTVRGFYAADGNAGNSGADDGNIWQVRFTPDRDGLWRYRAELRHGPDVAIADDPAAGELVPLETSSGRFLVVPSDKTGRDFRGHGRLIADGGYFRFAESGRYWLKGGTNSPENFLAYAGFDGTMLAATSARDGEAVRDGNLHRYQPHVADWRPGDPSWRDGRGKGIVGAVNYLSSTGMNAAYFLTFNIDGDGNDVWPFRTAGTVDRFDCSKLAQWEILFQHMQAKGILLHLVTQETENERLLDDGDTGPLRKLYYQELIARYGHHLALVWNLGEENGPADFSPNGQTDEQRKAMAKYVSAHDPYDHPIVLHTHATIAGKEEILDPLLGFTPLDGLSFQVDDRLRVNAEIAEWRETARGSGHDWLITMDEIGMWHTGAVPDSVDPNHDSLRRHALWGALLGGAAGVEWYFGARFPANDLSSEDWRLRERLWAQTRVALEFFSERRYWDYRPCNRRIVGAAYCAGLSGEEYVVYPLDRNSRRIDLSNTNGIYDVWWYDPLAGGALQRGSLPSVRGGGLRSLGVPPKDGEQDWVMLITRRQ